MKILIVNENLSEEGGAERYSLDVAVSLVDRGHDVLFVYKNLPKFSIFNLTKNTSTNFSQARNCQLSNKDKIRSAQVSGFNLNLIKQELLTFFPDVVYLQNVFDAEVTRYFRENFRTFRFIHDHATYCPGKSKMWFRQNKICEIPMSLKCGINAYCKKCMSRRPEILIRELVDKPRLLAENKKLEKLIVASDFMKNQLLLNGVPSDKVLVNPLFISPEFEKKSNKSNKSNGHEILFVGRIFIEKGLEYLLRALAMVKDEWHLNVIGEGWDLERCRRISEELGISGRVSFLGFLPHKETARYFEEAFVVVVPSIWPEPFCLVGLEAMAFSKPVIAFDVGSISTWLKDNKTGFLIKRGDVREMSDKIKLLFSDLDLCKKLGKEGKSVLDKEFTMERHIDSLEKEFSRSLN